MVEWISCFTEGVYTIGLRVPRYRASEKVYSTEKRKSGIKSRCPIAHGTTSKIWKQRVHRKELFNGVNLKNAVRVRQNFESKTLEETLQRERCARREAWGLAKNVYKLKMRDKATFYSLPKPGQCRHPLRKKPEEREIVVGSGASVHMLSKRDSSSVELDTLRMSRSPSTVITANGEVQTSEEGQAYVHDLELFVTVQIFDDTPAVLLLGKLYEEHGKTNEWVSCQEPHLTKNGTRILSNTENFVPVVVPQLSSS